MAGILRRFSHLLIQIELNLGLRHCERAFLLRSPQVLTRRRVRVLELLVGVPRRHQLLVRLLLLSALDLATLESAPRLTTILVLVSFVAGHVSHLQLSLARLAGSFALGPGLQRVHHRRRIQDVLLALLIVVLCIVQPVPTARVRALCVLGISLLLVPAIVLPRALRLLRSVALPFQLYLRLRYF